MDVGARMGNILWAIRRDVSEGVLQIFFGVVEGASLLGVCGAGRGIWCGKRGQQDGGRWSANNYQFFGDRLILGFGRIGR